jgi:hypothetical protein
MNWQPIETAPKDGSVIIGWHKKWQELSMIDFDNREKKWMGRFPGFIPFDQPTHWMPLPPPPNDADQQAELNNQTGVGQ